MLLWASESAFAARINCLRSGAIRLDGLLACLVDSGKSRFRERTSENTNQRIKTQIPDTNAGGLVTRIDDLSDTNLRTAAIEERSARRARAQSRLGANDVATFVSGVTHARTYLGIALITRSASPFPHEQPRSLTAVRISNYAYLVIRELSLNTGDRF